jgi:hypothetical protein
MDVKTEMSPEEVPQFCDANAEPWAADVRAGWDAYREHYNNPAFLAGCGKTRLPLVSA